MVANESAINLFVSYHLPIKDNWEELVTNKCVVKLKGCSDISFLHRLWYCLKLVAIVTTLFLGKCFNGVHFRFSAIGFIFGGLTKQPGMLYESSRRKPG